MARSYAHSNYNRLPTVLVVQKILRWSDEDSLTGAGEQTGWSTAVLVRTQGWRRPFIRGLAKTTTTAPRRLSTRL